MQRQVIGWFEVADKEAFSLETFPVFIFDDPQLGEYYVSALPLRCICLLMPSTCMSFTLLASSHE